MTQTTSQEPNRASEAQPQQAVDVKEVALPEVQPKAQGQTPKSPTGQIDILLDTAMPVTARLGQTEILIRQVLQLGPGSVLKLDRRVGEPVDLLLRGVCFAKGTLVVVGDDIGVRISEVLPAPPSST
jgi:flagellar motor switch protein FliN/FliY